MFGGNGNIVYRLAEAKLLERVEGPDGDSAKDIWRITLAGIAALEVALNEQKSGAQK